VAILLFVAWERYDNNAKKVEAMMTQGSPFGGESPFGGMMKQMTGKAQLKLGVLAQRPTRCCSRRFPPSAALSAWSRPKG